MTHGFDDVAGARFALRANEGRTFGDAAQCFTEIGGTTHERHGELEFVNVVGFVGWRQHFALVDEVDAECFEHLGFDEVPDASFRHDRNRHGCLDALDHLGVAHARHPTVTANVGGHAL
ncbi:MAG: hypothetical protein RLZZ284_790, partial [Actinomycetota bacterium]